MLISVCVVEKNAALERETTEVTPNVILLCQQLSKKKTLFVGGKKDKKYTNSNNINDSYKNKRKFMSGLKVQSVFGYCSFWALSGECSPNVTKVSFRAKIAGIGHCCCCQWVLRRLGNPHLAFLLPAKNVQVSWWSMQLITVRKESTTKMRPWSIQQSKGKEKRKKKKRGEEEWDDKVCSKLNIK